MLESSSVGPSGGAVKNDPSRTFQKAGKKCSCMSQECESGPSGIIANVDAVIMRLDF